MHLVDPANGTFTKQELERLTAYRSAVAAGFYTDWDGTAETTDSELLAWLQTAAPGTGDRPGAEYPFTTEERQRLEQCRAAVAGGYYSETEPPPDPTATSDQSTR
jgi:hypothetical protein